MKPGEVRREVERLEAERLLLAPEVAQGNQQAVSEDGRIGELIAERAGAERETRADELREAWRKNHPGGDEA